MNEKLICLLKASKEHALEYANILRGRTDTDATSKAFEHVELLKNAINALERENMNLTSDAMIDWDKINKRLVEQGWKPYGDQSAHARNQMHELKDNLDRLEHAVTELRVELTRATACLMSHAGATKNDIDKLGCKIMSAISDWKTKLDQTFDEIDTKLDTANTKLTGLTDDVAFLKETIEKLQTNPGPITPEDQALLDAAQARVNSLSAKAAAVSTALEALDAATERPVAPPLPA